MPEEVKIDSEDKLRDGNGINMYLIWIVWYANVFMMTILLFNFIVAVLFQSYEQIIHDMEAHRYKQKAELLVEAQRVLTWLGFNKAGDYDTAILIRKKKFSDDVADRLDKEKWQGFTKSIKTYLRFCVIARIESIAGQNEKTKKRTNIQLNQISRSIQNL